jgi:predicted nucleic acid-binding protein
VNALLDTSVLLEPQALRAAPDASAISVITLGELHFGVAIAQDAARRAERARRLGTVEALFDPLPVTPAIARIWGELGGAAVERGLEPRRRAADLLIAATAKAHGVPLLTLDGDLAAFGDLLDIRLVP